MKKNIRFFFISFLTVGIFTIFLNSCKKDEKEPVLSLPLINTTSVTPLLTTAEYKAYIQSDGGYYITQRGVCLSTNPEPTVNNMTTNSGAGAGTFTGKLTDLSPNTTYYIRAYAITSQGTSYGGTLKFTTLNTKINDIENNEYKVIQVGNQVWMAENLQVKKYNNNKPIPLITDGGIWKSLTSPAYCWYGNDSVTYGKTYGILYNGYAVSAGRLCPTGWHVPSVPEWDSLLINIGGSQIAGGKLKEKGSLHWTANVGATDDINFTALPGGLRYYDAGFYYINTYGLWWTSTPYMFLENYNYGVSLVNTSSYSTTNQRSKIEGNYVRCIKD